MNNRIRPFLIAFTVTFLTLFPSYNQASATDIIKSGALNVSDAVLKKTSRTILNKIAQGETPDIFIRMNEKADLTPAYRIKSKKDKGRFVFKTLYENRRGAVSKIRSSIS